MDDTGHFPFEYDIALSFAGEDRSYVRTVAESLRTHNIRIFYDEFELANIWGKNLYEYLDEIYRKKARYCIVFLSKNYSRKVWTTHERESAQARALMGSEEYILPARFDDTEIPGVKPTVAYIDLSKLTPEAFTEVILKKIGKRTDHVSISSSTQSQEKRKQIFSVGSAVKSHNSKIITIALFIVGIGFFAVLAVQHIKGNGESVNPGLSSSPSGNPEVLTRDPLNVAQGDKNRMADQSPLPISDQSSGEKFKHTIVRTQDGARPSTQEASVPLNIESSQEGVNISIQDVLPSYLSIKKTRDGIAEPIPTIKGIQ